MPITVEQKWQGAQVDNETITSEYIVSGTSDEFAAQAALDAYAAILVGTLVKQNARITGRISEDKWEGEVSWGKIDPPETGDSSFSFDTSGGNQHVTQSLATVGTHAAPGLTAPNFKGAIGVTTGSVDGVDITIPVYSFSETHYIDVALVTAGYKATLFGLTGTVNNGAFRGFSAGEVLFLGASGSQRGEEDWEISFRFVASPNVTGLVVGDITGIAKGGWEYLWVRYRDEEDTAAKALVKRPVAAYVEQVYPAGDFSGLGIGA